MAIKDAVNQPLSNWMKGSGPDSSVVVSSRIRLARNLIDYPFPHYLDEKSANDIMSAVRLAIVNSDFGEELGGLEYISLEELSLIERQILVEKHLISPLHAEGTQNRALILSRDESLSIMINEEDHIRIQVLLPAAQLTEAWEKANLVDDCIERTVSYCFCERRGFLTACPTNVGTGLRASVMMHLPALVMSGQINNIITAISQLGLAVRGYYGEGTKAVGQLFQISNQITLGQTEEEIVKNLLTVTKQIISQEIAARNNLYDKNKDQLEDRIFRSLGMLSYARLVSSEEALNMFSDLRLGIELGVLDQLSQQDINELMVVIRPAFLQKMTSKEMTPEERDLVRARIIRDKLEKIKQ